MPWISSNWTALSFENRVIAWLTGIWLLVVFIHLINTLRKLKRKGDCDPRTLTLSPTGKFLRLLL
jgi:hypothetical protein